MSAPSANHNAF